MPVLDQWTYEALKALTETGGEAWGVVREVLIAAFVLRLLLYLPK